MYTTIRHELRHARKAWPGTLEDPCLLSDYDYNNFYVTDGNIMYLTDASRFLISFVIQHYAPVVGWGGGTDA